MGSQRPESQWSSASHEQAGRGEFTPLDRSNTRGRQSIRQARFVAIQPKPSDNVNDDNEYASGSIQRRKQVDQACERCRIKRTKCDGNGPCQRCKTVGENCQYYMSNFASKEKLRAEVERLQNIVTESNTSSTPEDIQSSITERDDNDNFRTVSTNATTPHESHQDHELATAFDQMLSWRQCHHDMNYEAVNSEVLTRISLPPSPLDIYSSYSGVDTWTSTNWTKAHVRHLFDATITWDYAAFSLLKKDAFLQDYGQNIHRFCSSALVHAILALSLLLINGNEADQDTLPNGWSGSKRFQEVAMNCIRNKEAPLSLPSVQALGIMSLYQLRRGREVEAQKLAEECLTCITDLCEQKIPPEYQSDEQYTKTRFITYHGSVSIVRMLLLTTGRLFNTPIETLKENENHVTSCQIYSALDTVVANSYIKTGIVTGNQSYDAQVVATKLFQLIEIVHASIMQSLENPRQSTNGVRKMYTMCLNWYQDFFSLISSDGSRTPFILFTHMWYHFSLLCAFRPFISLGLSNNELRPIELCSQAAQSIISLTQSYDDLFTLQRISGMVPYFVLASGLFGQAMEDNNSNVEATYRLKQEQVPAMKQVVTSKQDFPPDQEGTPLHSSYIETSIVDHALFLLTKMASTHPLAKVAERKLRRR